MMTNPSEYRRAYGGGVDDRVEWRGRTGGYSLCPWGLMNLINEFRVALMPPRKRVVLPRRCRVLLNTLRRLGNRVRPQRGSPPIRRWWLRQRWSLLLWWKGL
jgi:hypothetical protein